MGDVLDQVSRIVRVEPDNSYRLLGVRLKGKGAFHRETKLGSEISAKFLDRVKDGDFIYSRLYAWHGAFSLIGADLDGAYVSNEFPIFRAKPSAKIDLSYLNFWLRQSRVWKIVEEDCQGSTPLTRNRFKEEFFNALRIQLPRGVEQERIVAHLDAIEERLTRVQKLRESARLEIEALTTSLHFGLAQGRQAKLDQLLVLDEEQETIVPEGSYPQVGIRSFGMGMFTKPAVTGSETTYRSFNVLRPGKLVMSQVKGWEGAVGVVTDNLDGWFVSPEYRTFSCISNECDPSYLSFLVA
ncbi:MAG: restriction endonuclease subunit S, partial [Actinobacteria bacterium]|nr:restriction endonuclease subunit S [Actinomycetota bacterium]